MEPEIIEPETAPEKSFSQTPAFWAIVIVLVALIFGWWWFARQSQPPRPGETPLGDDLTRSRLLQSLEGGEGQPLSEAQRRKVLQSLGGEQKAPPLSAEDRARLLESLQ